MTAGLPLTEAEEWAIADRLAAGWTSVAVAADMRVARSTVARVAHQHRSVPVVRLPPIPTAERDTSWRDRGRCVPLGARFVDLPVEEQILLCRGDDTTPGCPVRPQCQSWGLRQHIPPSPDGDWPVYGGFTAGELYRLQRQLANARSS